MVRLVGAAGGAISMREVLAHIEADAAGADDGDGAAGAPPPLDTDDGMYDSLLLPCCLDAQLRLGPSRLRGACHVSDVVVRASLQQLCR